MPAGPTAFAQLLCPSTGRHTTTCYTAVCSRNVGRVAQSVLRLPTGWTVRGSNPGGGEIFRPSRPALGPISLLYNGYRVFPGVKCGRGVKLTPHLILMPWSRKSTAIPLLPLWAVRPVQSLSTCTRVHFTFRFYPLNCFTFYTISSVSESEHLVGLY